MTGLEKLIKGFYVTLALILLCASTFAEPTSEPLEPPVSDTQQSEKKDQAEKLHSTDKTSQQSENNEYIPKPTRRQSGFIVKDIAKSGFILKSFKPDTMLGNGEIVYVDKGELEELKIGQRFTLFSAKRKIFRPKIVNEEILDLELDSFDRTTDSYYMAANDPEVTFTKPIKKMFKFEEKIVGVLVKKLGTIEILGKNQFAYKAIILESFAPIKSGDRFVPREDQDFAKTRKKEIDFANFESVIMAFSKVGTLASKNDIIMIDKGSEDGLITGDRLEIFVKPKKIESGGLKFWQDIELDMPTETIGQIQILSTRKTTSTAIILFNKREVLRGQRVRFPKIASNKSTSPPEEESRDLAKP